MTGDARRDDSPATAFLGPQPRGHAAYATAMDLARDTVLQHLAPLDACYGGEPAAAQAQRFESLEILPDTARPLQDVLQWVGRNVLHQSVVVAHPRTMAHLHCPPLVPALAAETLVNAANQSMDSWDQAPAATYLEQRLVRWMAAQLGLPGGSDGVFTSGGTQSNFMGLLLARNLHARHAGWDIQQAGLPGDATAYRILCSDVAHFSVAQSAAILGLGHAAVVPVATDERFRMRADALERAVGDLRAQGLQPIAVVATAGSTDFGSIDPLAAIAGLCREHGIWLHVDAAYGGALALGGRHARLLEGIGDCDSVTIDCHKLFWQPVSCSMLLVRDSAAWEVIRLHADYLNPEENEDSGVLDLVTKSIQTTRRFDGLKLFVTLQALGRRGFGALLDRNLELAQEAGELVRADPELELAADPMLVSVVFRYRTAGRPDEALDRANATARRALLLQGQALIGMTRVRGRVHVKFTLMNPLTTLDDLRAILDAFKRQARAALA